MKKNSAKDLTVEREDKGRDSPESTGKKNDKEEKRRTDLEVLKLPRRRER